MYTLDHSTLVNWDENLYYSYYTCVSLVTNVHCSLSSIEGSVPAKSVSDAPIKNPQGSASAAMEGTVTKTPRTVTKRRSFIPTPGGIVCYDFEILVLSDSHTCPVTKLLFNVICKRRKLESICIRCWSCMNVRTCTCTAMPPFFYLYLYILIHITRIHRRKGTLFLSTLTVL